MIRRVPLAATAALILALAACKNDNPNPADLANAEGNAAMTDNGMMGNDMASATPMAPPLSTKDFAAAIAAGGKFEIDSAKVAGEKATNPALKALAAEIAADHTKAADRLKLATEQAKPAFVPTATLTSEQSDNLAKLKAATTADFDKLYVTQQIAAHQAALSALNGYAAGGEGTAMALKTFASDTATVVKGHLDKLTAMPH